MGKIVETRNLYKETINSITQTEENWLNFLDSMAWNFKYDFDDQVLIYAQRPDAKACASMEEWNRKLRRWVKKSSNAIFIQEKDENSQYPFKLVFDISDTYNARGTEYKLWEIKPEYENEIIYTLESTFGITYNENNENKSLAKAIYYAAFNMVEDNIQDYMEMIKNNKIGTKLESLDDTTIEQIAVVSAISSVTYVIMTRCGIKAREHINLQDISLLKYFDNDNVIASIGHAISDIAENGLREIAKSVFELQKNEKNRNYTFDKEKNIVYANDENKEKGGNEYESNNLYKIRGLQHTKYDNGERNNTNREIRNNEIEIPKTTQQTFIYNISNESRTSTTFNGNTGNSEEQSRADNERDGIERGNKRGDEISRPNEMGTTNEQLEDDSRGDSREGNNLRLNVYEKTNDIGYVVAEEKINQILAKTTYLTKYNSEIIEFFNEEKNTEKRAEYLKKITNEEYTEFAIDNERYGYKKFDNGMLFWKDNFLNRTAESFVSWNNLTYHFDSMILLNQIKDRCEIPKNEIEQQNLIEELDKSSADFEFTQEFIDKFLQEESPKLKFRIYTHFRESLSSKSNIELLKQIYGIGGRSHTIRGSGIGVSYDAKGMKFNRGYLDESSREKLFNWNYIEKRINELINLNLYFNQNELAEYPKWLEEQENQRIQQENIKKQENEEIKKEYELAEKVYKYISPFDLYDYPDESKSLNTDEQNIEIVQADINDKVNVADYVNALKEKLNNTENTEMQNIEIQDLISILEPRIPHYEYHLGDKLYIGASEYELLSIDNNIVTLYDPKFPLFTQQLEFQEFDRKIKENPSNNHLIVENYTSTDESNLISKDLSIQEDNETDENDSIVEKTYKVGDIVCLESERKYQINKIDVENDKISLLDLDINYPIFREESILTFENLYYKNERNISKENQEKSSNISNTQNIEPSIVRTKRKIQDFILYPEIPENARNNFKITDNELGVGGQKEKYARNIEAIKVLKKCEEENRYATPEEQKILSQYVGWGGLADAFEKNKPQWSNEYNELKNLLNAEEYSQAKESTLTAFYTPPIVISAIYKALQNMGLSEANILEPSCRNR